MPQFERMVGVAAVALCAALLAGCPAPRSDLAIQGTEIVAPLSPPPKRAEIPPPAPSADSLWQAGDWHWDGGKYVWRPGRYIQRPAPTANWLPGYWEQDSRGWVWTDGRWAT
jgi:hypothetical protein